MARVPDCGFIGIADSRCPRRAHERFLKSDSRAQVASADTVGFHRVPQTELQPIGKANDPCSKSRRTKDGDPNRWRPLHQDGSPGATAGRPSGYSCSGTPSSSCRVGWRHVAARSAGSPTVLWHWWSPYLLHSVWSASWLQSSRKTARGHSGRVRAGLLLACGGTFVSPTARPTIVALALGTAATGHWWGAGTQPADESRGAHCRLRDGHMLRGTCRSNVGD